MLTASLRTTPRLPYPVRPGLTATHYPRRLRHLPEGLHEDGLQTKGNLKLLTFFTGRVRVAIPGAKPVTLQTQSSLRPSPEQREKTYFLQHLRTNILTASKAFRSQLASTPIIIKLPSSAPVTVQPLQDGPSTSAASSPTPSLARSDLDHTDPEATPDRRHAGLSDHTSFLYQPQSTAMPDPSPPARLTPSQPMQHPPNGSRPTQSTPPHLRNALGPQTLASSPSLPRGRSSPTGRLRRDQPTAVSDLGWKQKYNVKLRFIGFPRSVSTLDVWSAFTLQGNIDSIDLNTDQQGLPDGSGLIRFK